MRYFLHLAYDGGLYHGWQSQPGDVTTVQNNVEAALATILRRPVPVTGAGRTDTGVNALNMVAHLDLAPPETDGLVWRMGALLPRDIAVRSLTAVAHHANARYDAVSRTYHYHVTGRRNPFLGRKVLWLPNEPDFELMNRAAAFLLGRHDFTSLSRTHAQTHTNFCTVTHARWHGRPDGGATFVITADRFLRGMVRAAVGTLLEIGRGARPAGNLADVLAARDRRAAGQAADPRALFLAAIEYPYFHGAALPLDDVASLPGG